MTRYTPMWVQPGRYPAVLDRIILGSIWPWPASTGFNIIGIQNWAVTVGPGTVAVPTTNNTGTVLCASTANEVITHSPAPGSNQIRYDLICVAPKAIDLDGVSPTAEWTYHVEQGPVMTLGQGVQPTTPPGMVALWLVRFVGGTAAIDSVTDFRPKRLFPGQAQNHRMYAASQTVLSNGVWSPVLNMAEYPEYPTDIVFDAGANNFANPPALVVPYDGLYYVSVLVYWQNNNAQITASGECHSGFGLQIGSGTPYKVREWKGWGQVGTFAGSGGSDTIWLPKNTRVSLWAMHIFGGYGSTGTIMGTWPGDQFTWLTMSYLGRIS